MAHHPRNGSIDILKLLGAFGIILFHSGAPYASVGLAALPMFVMLLVYFGVRSPFASTANRLLKIWVIWSAIYAGLKLAQGVISGTKFELEFEPWMVWTGTSIHLWFLPFCVLVLATHTLILRHLSDRALISASITVSVFCLFAAQGPAPIPLAQWATVVPAACAGLIMARVRRPVLPALVLAGFGTIAWLLRFTASSDQLAIAGLTVAAAFHFPTKGTALTDCFGPLSLGLYLIHPAVIALSLYAWGAGSLALFFAASTISFAACLLALKVAPITIGHARTRKELS